MKWITRATVLFAVLTLSAIAAWAQDQTCTEDYLNETYSKWYEPYQKRANDPKQGEMAYQIAKEYVGKCPNAFPDNAYAKALKSYVKGYEEKQATGKLEADFKAAITNKKYPDIMRLGKQIVAIDPNNSKAYLWMGYAGLSDSSLLAEGAVAAKKAIELVEAGQPIDVYATKEQALAAMNDLLGRATLKTAPTDAIPYFIKAVKSDNKNPELYKELAAAYAVGPRAKLTEEYKAKQTSEGNETPESKLVLANLNEVIDRQIDATARAAALTTDAAKKKELMDSLTDDYKFRKGSDTGLNEFVAGILAKPLPDPPTPITTLPTPTPTSTPAGAGASPAGSAVGNSAGGSSISNTAKPAGASPTTTSSKPSTSGTTGGAKPAASPTPKPRPRRSNHRG